MIRSVSQRVALAALLFCTTAGCCARRGPNADLDTLLAAYRQQNAQLEQSRERLLTRGIERLVVEPVLTGQPLVSVDLQQARLGVVVGRILSQAGVGYVAEVPRLPGMVSARFERRPLLEALQALLAPAGFTAGVRDGLVAIVPAGEGATPSEPARAARFEPGTAEVPLSFVRTARAAEILDALYPLSESTGLRPVQFAPVPETNSLLLSGAGGQVDAARRLLETLDRDPGHIMLEALVVEFNIQSFREIGSHLTDGAFGDFSDVSLDVAELIGETLTFTRVADAAHTTAFRAVLELLLMRNEARVLSRPYLSAVSGSKAHLEVAEDRFVLVTTPGEINVTLEPVSSGVKLDLVPTLTADGSILLEIGVEQSQFQPTLENIEQRRARNSVTTSVQVMDGQTVIVGGLMLRTRAMSEAGLPILRHMPFLNFILRHEDMSKQDNQVMVFITPYRWEPGMDTPLRAVEPFEIYPTRGPAVSQREGQPGSR
ncbi:MAG TPA: secretin N-terminal domain-containing protein [Vicinamibacterales bacterium]